MHIEQVDVHFNYGAKRIQVLKKSSRRKRRANLKKLLNKHVHQSATGSQTGRHTKTTNGDRQSQPTRDRTAKEGVVASPLWHTHAEELLY